MTIVERWLLKFGWARQTAPPSYCPSCAEAYRRGTVPVYQTRDRNTILTLVEALDAICQVSSSSTAAETNVRIFVERNRSRWPWVSIDDVMSVLRKELWPREACERAEQMSKSKAVFHAEDPS